MQKIAPAFVKAKKAFGPALKDKTNPAFRSKYADLGACLEAVEDPLLANGIAVYQETFEDATGVTVETVFLHESGETIRCGKLHVPASKQDPQGYGSALTYARRYSLMAACGIAPEDDDGNAASKPRPATKITPAAAILEDAAISDERKDQLDKLAVRVSENFLAFGPQSAYEVIAEEGLDDMEKIYLSTKLVPSVRNPIKAYSQQLKKAA